MKNNTSAIALATSLLLLTCFPVKTVAETKEKEFPVVVFSAYTHYGFSVFIFGMYLEMTNLTTGAIYKSRALNGRYAIIESIPQVEYVVSYCEVSSGESIWFSSNSVELSDFFGIIVIDTDSIWYLGDFRISANYKRAVVKRAERMLPERVLKRLRNNGYDRYGICIYKTPETAVTLKGTTDIIL